MSKMMSPIPFGQLMEWILAEHKKGSVFGIDKPYNASNKNLFQFCGRKLENPIGPAAGPHTQLAQNIIACYYAGARFFELKTVQTLDGEDIAPFISKPCILAEDEAYNCEWSTELTVQQALEEYIKAWVAIHVIAKEFALGDPDGFQFNMSVGYNLEGIQSKKIDHFIETLKDAGSSLVFKECREWLLSHLDLLEKLTKEDVQKIPAEVCSSVTLSTMHGCPVDEIERIAAYLLRQKHVHTYVKCNPTLLDYDFVRRAMDDLGYGYMVFDDSHFKDDLHYEEAVPMLQRLLKTAEEEGLCFGVKLTNTFPVKAALGELPSEEMYMSGRALFPLAVTVAARLSKSFEGRLPISFSGGADLKNIECILNTGIHPVTLCTALLKTGGLIWLSRMASKIEDSETVRSGLNRDCISAPDLKAISEDALYGPLYKKGTKKEKLRRGGKSPLFDCLKKSSPEKTESLRTHTRVCGNCVDVCPNRANVLIEVPSREFLQIIHIDNICNECGNCTAFCHYESSPFREKFTLYKSEADLDNGSNNGFSVISADSGETVVRIEGVKKTVQVFREEDELSKLICTVIKDYPYLLQKE